MHNSTEKPNIEAGVGLEIEGFFMGGEGPTVRIEGLPASEWIMQQVQKNHPQLVNHIAVEQASVVLELQSSVHTSDQKAAEQILEIRQALNDILSPQGSHLIFKPVLDNDNWEFLAASSNPNSRTHELIRKWRERPNGEAMLKASATASLQINDSRPFKALNGRSHDMEAKLELARRIHNLYSAHFEELNAHNGKITDKDGQSRLDKASSLLQTVKAEQFHKFGYHNTQSIVRPGQFETIEAMQRWMMAHSDVDNFEKASPKNEHGLTVKIKRPETGLWIAEARLFDSVDTLPAIMHRMMQNRALLRKLDITLSSP